MIEYSEINCGSQPLGYKCLFIGMTTSVDKLLFGVLFISRWNKIIQIGSKMIPTTIIWLPWVFCQCTKWKVCHLS